LYHVLCANLAINAIENVAAAQVALGAAPGFIRVPLLRSKDHVAVWLNVTAFYEEAARSLQYPELMLQAHIQGRVLVQAIIDTSGRAEPPSVKVIQSPNPGFDQPAKNLVLKSLFRPARVHGRAVRVLINLPIDFSIKR